MRRLDGMTSELCRGQHTKRNVHFPLAQLTFSVCLYISKHNFLRHLQGTYLFQKQVPGIISLMIFRSKAVNESKSQQMIFKIFSQSRLDRVVSLSCITGGEASGHTGGKVNHLCLPHNPKYDKYKNRNQHVTAVMYGVEYRVDEYNGDPFKRSLHDYDAPCAVCYVKSCGSMLMMPARNDCPYGWTEEYHGYLMTSHYTDHNPKI